MPREAPFVALVMVTSAVLLAGCGPNQGGEAEPRAYARAVCSGLAAWQRGVTGDSADLSRSLQVGGADLATVKARYTRFFAGAVGRTDELVRAVDRAGAPKVDNGLAYARDLRTALVQTRAGLAAAQARFAALPTADLRSYAAGAKKIRDSLGTLFAEVGRSLERLGTTYPDSALNDAFRDEPDCQSLP